MINLLITGDPEEWESKTALLYRERCLTEHITEDMKTRFSAFRQLEIAQIKQLPCIFAYEQSNKKDAHRGIITDISVRQSNIKIVFQLSEDTISYETFTNPDFQKQLDMGK
jgi:hypothetical protein